MSTIERTRPAAKRDADQTETTPPASVLRSVPIGAIKIRPDFNPRTERDPESWDRTAATVREHGVLAPLLVTPTAPDAETYWLIAGEGRYRAAVEAEHETVPALVLSTVDERTLGVELALIENMAREALDPVAQARGFARLRDAKWSSREIAEALSVTQKMVGERLRILKVPEKLHPLIVSEDIPLSAIRPLAQLATIHPDLPAVLVARVLKGSPPQTWVERIAWPAAVEAPISALTADYNGPGCDLPQGVYNSAVEYDPNDLPLADDTRQEICELASLSELPPDAVRIQISPEGIEQARALKAAWPSESGSAHLIVGEDVVAQVIADRIGAALKKARKAVRDAARQQDDASPATSAVATESSEEVAPTESPEEVAEQRRAEHAERLERQRKARAHNADLGAAVGRSLARVKLDPKLLQTLLAAQPLSDLAGLAARGARYCLPGWPIHDTTPTTGKPRTTYMDPNDARERALEFLRGASTTGEISGRLLSLVALARYADEDAVALSRRAAYALPSGDDLPWDQDTLDAIDAICVERLPDHLTRPAREARRAEVQARKEHERQRDAAKTRVESATERLDQLNDEKRAALLADAVVAYGRYSPQVWELKLSLADLDKKDADTTETSESADSPDRAESVATDDTSTEAAPAKPAAS